MFILQLSCVVGAASLSWWIMRGHLDRTCVCVCSRASAGSCLPLSVDARIARRRVLLYVEPCAYHVPCLGARSVAARGAARPVFLSRAQTEALNARGADRSVSRALVMTSIVIPPRPPRVLGPRAGVARHGCDGHTGWGAGGRGGGDVRAVKSARRGAWRVGRGL